MPTGYCTIEDVRRALLETTADFESGDLGANNNAAVIDAIAAQTEWLEKALSRHWYVPGGISEDDEGLVPTGPKTRDDEHDIPRHGAMVHGASEAERYRFSKNSDALLESGPRYEARREDFEDPKEEIRLAFGDLHDESVPAYTRIRFDRRDVDAVNELHVVNADGAYDDWASSDDYDGGVGNQYRGQDWWVRVNNGGVSELYLDVHAMDDDLASLSNAVYVDIDFGHEGLPRTARRAVAFRAGADLVEEAVIEIPQNATVYNVETKAQNMREKAEELLEVYRV